MLYERKSEVRVVKMWRSDGLTVLTHGCYVNICYVIYLEHDCGACSPIEIGLTLTSTYTSYRSP